MLKQREKIQNNLSIIFHNFHACALKNKYEITLNWSELLYEQLYVPCIERLILKLSKFSGGCLIIFQ